MMIVILALVSVQIPVSLPLARADTITTVTFEETFQSDDFIDEDNTNASIDYGDQEVTIPSALSINWSGLSGDPYSDDISENLDFSSQQNFILDSNGRPIVVWTSLVASNFYYEVFITRWNGSAWTKMDGVTPGQDMISVTSSSNGDSYIPRLVLDSSDNPMVVWKEWDSTFGFGGSNYIIRFSRWNGSAWTGMDGVTPGYETISSGNSISDEPQIILDSTGKPLVVWQQWNGSFGFGGANYDIRISRWNGSQWTQMNGVTAGTEIVAGSSAAGQSLYPQIQLDTSDNPIVAWQDQTPTGTQTYVSRWNGSAWTQMDGTTAGFNDLTGNSAGYKSSVVMILDAANNPVVTWADWSTGFENYISRWNGSIWTGMDGTTPGFSSLSNFDGSGGITHKLAIDAVGNIYAMRVSAVVGQSLIFSLWNGTMWTAMDGVTPGYDILDDPVNYYYGVEFDASGFPVVGWNSGNGVARFSRWNGSMWTQIDNSTAGYENASPSGQSTYNMQFFLDSADAPIATWIKQDLMTSDNNIHVSHYDATPRTATIQSESVNGGTTGILTVILDATANTPGASYIEYFMTGDGGTTWIPAVPGTLYTFNPPTTDLRWKAILYPGSSPVLTSVTLTYTFSSVPGDILFSQTGGSTTVNEGGPFDSYTVTLATAPTTDVTVTLGFDDDQIRTKNNLETIIFTPLNWNVPRTVEVKGLNDGVTEGNHTTPIVHTASSADPSYDGISKTLTVQIKENGGGGGGGGSLPGVSTPGAPTPPVVTVVGLPADDRPIPLDTALHFHATDTSPVNPGIDLDSFQLTINDGLVPSAFIQGAVGINPAEADFHFQPSASTQLLPEGDFSLSVEVRNKSALPASVDKSLRTQGGGYLGYHYSCVNSACVQVSGVGDDACRVVADCDFSLSVITNNIEQGTEESSGNENGSVVDNRVTLAGNGGEDIFTFQDDIAMGGALPDFNAAVSTYLEDNDTQRALLKSKNNRTLTFVVARDGNVTADETTTELFDKKEDLLRGGEGLGLDSSLEKHYVLLNFDQDLHMTFADQTILSKHGTGSDAFIIQVQRLLNRKYLPDPSLEKLAQIKDEFVPVAPTRYSFSVVNDQYQPVLEFDRPVAIYAEIPMDFPAEFLHHLTFYKYAGTAVLPIPTIVDSERGFLKGITHTTDSFYVGMKTHMPRYRDVADESPVNPYVYDLTSSNIVSGYADLAGTYGPENCVLRSELVKMVIGSFDLPASHSSDSLFGDVTNSDWFYPYLRGAVEAKVLMKNTQGKFHPNSCVSRGDAVKIMVLAGQFPYQYYDDGSTVFSDVKKSDPFLPYLSYAHQFGIIFGFEDGTFKPSENLARSEVTSLLWHAIQSYGEQGRRFGQMWEGLKTME